MTGEPGVPVFGLAAARRFARCGGMAWSALRAFRLRSFFVVAAVALGIAALTVIVAALEGAERKAEEITEMFGPDAVLVLSGRPLRQAVGERSLTLTAGDAVALRQALPGAYLVVPMRSRGTIRLKYGSRNYDVNAVVGGTENYAEAWNWPLAEGRDLTAADVAHGARVALLGDKPSRELFGEESPVGKTFLMGGLPMTAVGRTVSRGVAHGGPPIDDRIIIPLSTLTHRFNMDRHHFTALRIKFTDTARLDRHIADLRSLLRMRHRLDGDQSDDFTIMSANDVRRFISMLKGGLGVFLGVTAVVAMMVGGFVLANLFHLSVSERRREIGLKKALGAPSSAILLQFLQEAVLLTLAGALLGLGLGLLMGQALARLGFLEISLSLRVFLSAALAAVAVGLVFGLRPAREAAALDPIRALRGGE